MNRLALLAPFALLFALSAAMAADHDAAYYARTATKPPVQGDFLLGPGLQYADQLGVSLTFGYHWQKTGIVLLGSAAYVRIDGVDTTAPLTIGWPSPGHEWGSRTVSVPVHVDGRTTGQYGMSVLFPLRRPR
jgi:hypothetical protein